jgi:N-acetylmuramic acid 6-phosphate etherase
MLKTEAQDARFVDIDSWPTDDAVAAMLDGQLEAVAAIRAQVANIAAASEAAAVALRGSGRLIYVGAGTSGRIAVQDGAELGPTFGWPQERLAYVVAGGMGALIESVEAAEDDAATGQAETQRLGCGVGDVVIGVAASGRTPFTVSAITVARKAGALTIGISNNPDAPVLDAAAHPILADTGSELIAGSTRMKAGTAQKVILNLLSTAIMLRLGRVYRGLMVDMVISNEKLEGRGRGMVAQLTGCTTETAAAALDAAGNDIKLAVLIAQNVNEDRARALLDAHGGNLRGAIDALGKS